MKGAKFCIQCITLALFYCVAPSHSHASSSGSSSSSSSSSNSGSISCPATYAVQSNRPLLFGGVYTGCLSGCQPRNDIWSERENGNCNPLNVAVARTCKAYQQKAAVRAARQAAGHAVVEFGPCELYSYLQGRTLWLIGDSLMKHYYYALICFMLDFWDHQAGECAVSANSTVQEAIWRAADTNHTNVLQQKPPITSLPKCVHLLNGGRICVIHSVRGEEIAAGPSEPEAPSLLKVLQTTVAQSHDIFYVHFARWHFHNCVGLQAGSYSHSLTQLGKLYNRTRLSFPNMFFKVGSHDHTQCEAQGVPTEPVTQCVPIKQGNYSASIGRRLETIAESILNKYGLPLVSSYNFTVGLYQLHLHLSDGTMDCTHWCSPGLPEYDIWMMYNAFKTQGIKSAVSDHSSSLGGQYTAQTTTGKAPASLECVPITNDRPPEPWIAERINKYRNSSSQQPSV